MAISGSSSKRKEAAVRGTIVLRRFKARSKRGFSKLCCRPEARPEIFGTLNFSKQGGLSTFERIESSFSGAEMDFRTEEEKVSETSKWLES